jgi:hypothetical protein
VNNRLGGFVMLSFPLFLHGCGSDSPTGGPADTSAPGVGSVTGVDANHLQLTFTEAVKKETAERRTNYAIVETTIAGAGVLAPGDTTHVRSAVLDGDGRTVTITTQEPMQARPYDLSVTGVEDLSGNKIAAAVTASFSGTDAADTTPPAIVLRTPTPGAADVGIGESVVVQFNESMNRGSVEDAFLWSSSSGPVSWRLQEEGANRYVFRPREPLLQNTVYTVVVQGSAQDASGNALGGDAGWTFTTTAAADATPPALVASVPANGAVNVAVTTDVSMTFSEAIEPTTSLEDVVVTPDLGDGVVSWSNGGRTVTFDPDVDLMDDTAYTLIILPGGVRDLAGNGNAGAIQITWSTGSSLPTGRISGVIAGDPGTPAADPAGAIVIAAEDNPFGSSDDFGIAGSGVVGANGSYSITNLRDGWYFPVSAMDSNGDGSIDPDRGDAIGAYGVVLGEDNVPDSVQVTGGRPVTGIDFALFDPMAIAGTLSYSGTLMEVYPLFVGVFDTTGFDAGNLPEPVYGTQSTWPFQRDYSVDEFDNGLAPGTYYVGAFLDVNFSGSFDSGLEPAGLYGGAEPTAITLGPGEDALHVDILMQDPGALQASRPLSWVPRRPAADRGLVEAAARMRRALARRVPLDRQAMVGLKPSG